MEELRRRLCVAAGVSISLGRFLLARAELPPQERVAHEEGGSRRREEGGNRHQIDDAQAVEIHPHDGDHDEHHGEGGPREVAPLHLVADWSGDVEVPPRDERSKATGQ